MFRSSIVPLATRGPWAALSAGVGKRARLAAVSALVGAGALIGLAAGTATAQTGPAVLIDGNAAVTGFSGTQPPLPFPPEVADKATIDLNGPAARVMDLQSPGAPPQAQLLTAPKPFTVVAGQVGQVFAVALDSATPPNIYLGATSSYGLPIVVPGPDGAPMRTKQGGPNASFMPGLFGPAAQGGGPGSIWRVDGVTGEVRLFANVTLDGMPNTGPALGGLAFDAASNTLFAADRETGMIHRFDLAGRERGRFDHGTQGRMAAGLAPVPYDPSMRLDIGSPRFQSDNPATWGYAPFERLVYGLAVHSGRLYYAVADGLQIWSVAISPDGTFGSDPRIEIQVSPWDGGSEVSKITFDNPGRMLLAERPAATGAYDFAALAKPGVGRVLRYRNVTPPAGGQTTWAPDPDEYAIGFPADMRNGNGGVAVGYGYTPNGQIDRAACSAFLWSTGEQLRNTMDPALIARLASSGPPIVNGLQGNAIGMVRPANVPPLQTYFVDYTDNYSQDSARGHLGDVAIWRNCGQASGQVPVVVPFGLIGGGGGVCLPGAFRLRDGQCCDRRDVRDGRCGSCPPDEIRLPNGQCCDRQDVRDGRCGCPPDAIRLPDGMCCDRRDVRDGRCGCPPDEIRLPNGMCCDRRDVRDGKCGCPPDQIRLPDGMCCDRRDVRDGKCGCPPDQIRLPNGQCCDRRDVRDGRCGGCPPDQIKLPNGMCCDRQNVRDGRCLPPSTCPPGQIQLPNGQCCDRANVRDGRCLPPPQNNCPTSQVKLPNGQCCNPANVQNGQCLPTIQSGCAPGETKLPNGRCCPNQDIKDGRCEARPILKDQHPPLRHLKVYEPREPVTHPTFHTHIPTGVIIQGNPGITRTPSFPSRGGGSTVPGNGKGTLMLR
jgi:hypothetical protein